MALALETTASSVGTLASFESESRRVAETGKAKALRFPNRRGDEDITSVDGVDVRETFEALKGAHSVADQADARSRRGPGEGASATVRAGRDASPGWTTASSRMSSPFLFFEKVAVKLFNGQERRQEGARIFESSCVSIIGGGKPSRLVAAPRGVRRRRRQIPEEEKENG